MYAWEVWGSHWIVGALGLRGVKGRRIGISRRWGGIMLLWLAMWMWWILHREELRCGIIILGISHVPSLILINGKTITVSKSKIVHHNSSLACVRIAGT